MKASVKKILLLFPPANSPAHTIDVNPIPPMGLGYLASTLEAAGYSVKILDALVRGWERKIQVGENSIRIGLAPEIIAKEIEEYAPDLVGVSCQFSRNHSIYHEMFDLIKSTDSNIVTVGGGAHVTVMPEDLLSNENCDYIISGEGEEPLLQFVDSYNSDELDLSIQGLGYRNEDGTITNNKRLSYETELDDIPFPSYHLMDLELYFGLELSHGLRHKVRFTPVISSRGCPAKCTFCSAEKVWGKKFRARSAENVIQELKMLKAEYGIEEIMFEDDNLTADPKRARELFQAMIDSDLGIVWDTPNGTGIWTLDEDIIDLMQASGCTKLNFPVESGNQRVLLKVIKKPLKLDKVERLTEHCRKIGLNYGMFLVVGMPGEKIHEMWESFNFAAKCRVFSPHISVATPYPGTKLYDEAIDKGLFGEKLDLDDLFIRSYLLETEDWSSKQLKRTVVNGMIYLKIRQAFVDLNMFKWTWSLLNKPRETISKISTFFLDAHRNKPQHNTIA